jgi:hypothetical protein
MNRFELLARRTLAQYAKNVDIRVKLNEDAIAFPTRRCSTCKGTGAARMVEHQGAMVPQGMCTTCRGFRFVEMSVDELREAYSELRTRGSKQLHTTPGGFDALVRFWLPEDPTPGHWLHYAKIILSKGRA